MKFLGRKHDNPWVGADAPTVDERLESLRRLQSEVPEDIRLNRRREPTRVQADTRSSDDPPLYRVHAHRFHQSQQTEAGPVEPERPASSESRCFYMMLGVPPEASHAEIERAYRRCVAVMHPDRYAHNPAMQAHEEKRLRDLNGFMHKLRESWGR